MAIYQPYTYLIGWTTHNKYYYGVRFAKNCHPDELWKSYFTSSKHVKNFCADHGPPDLIKIRKTFNSAEPARLWESKVLHRMDVIHNEKWLNKSSNIAIASECCSHPCSEERKQLYKKLRTGHKESEETRNKKRQAMIGKNVGKRNTDEQRQRKSLARKGRTYQEIHGDGWREIIEKARQKKIGRVVSEETKRRISEATKGRVPWNKKIKG